MFVRTGRDPCNTDGSRSLALRFGAPEIPTPTETCCPEPTKTRFGVARRAIAVAPGALGSAPARSPHMAPNAGGRCRDVVGSASPHWGVALRHPSGLGRSPDLADSGAVAYQRPQISKPKTAAGDGAIA